MAEKKSKLFFGGKAVDDFVENHEHVSPTSMYLKVLGALFVLTALTYAVSYANLGPASLTVAMLVAAVKASLVCAFFMHLKYDDRYLAFIFVSSLLFVGIFFTFVIFDIGARDRLAEMQATEYQRTHDPALIGRMYDARMGERENSAMMPQCSDGTTLTCDQTFEVCNPDGGHGDAHAEGHERLIRKVEGGCFVSTMVPVAADASGVLFVAEDGSTVDVDGHLAKAVPNPRAKEGEPKINAVVVDDKGAPVAPEDIAAQKVHSVKMVDGGCVSKALGCVNPESVEGVQAAAKAAAAPAEDAASEGAPDAKAPDAKAGEAKAADAKAMDAKAK